jgi:hypothetical protein
MIRIFNLILNLIINNFEIIIIIFIIFVLASIISFHFIIILNLITLKSLNFLECLLFLIRINLYLIIINLYLFRINWIAFHFIINWLFGIS